MNQNEKEDLIWKHIKPADNAMTPSQSDGYNEEEVFSACWKVLSELDEIYLADAEKWRELQCVLNAWSEKHEDGPTNEVIGEAWWNIVNG